MSLRERILVGGSPGTGKTYAWATIARALPKSKFYVIDPDDGVRRVLYEVDTETGERVFPDLSNIEYYLTPKWYTEGSVEVPTIKKLVDSELHAYQSGVADAWKTIKPKLKEDDWIVVEHLGSILGRAQDGFANEVFNKDIGQYFLEKRKLLAAGSKRLDALEGWTDWCVDEETEILTSQGWKKYNELSVSQDVFTINEHRQTHFEPLSDVYIGPNKSRQMVHMVGQSHDSLSTSEHRWLTFNQTKKADKYIYNPKWKTTSTLGILDSIPMTGIRVDNPLTNTYPDNLVELVAWYITDGWGGKTKGRKTYGGGIGQSNRAHPQYVCRIRTILNEMFGPERSGNGWSESKETDTNFITFNLQDKPIQMLEKVAPHKIPSHEFILALTHDQLGKFIDTCVMGDGSGIGTIEPVFGQVNKERVHIFEFVCALYGTATRAHKNKGGGTGCFGNKVMHTVNLLNSKNVWPINAAHQVKYSNHPKTGRAAKIEVINHDGIVWCPVTPSGTWLAKRNGTVYFTGNSVINKMHNDDFIIPICYENPAHVFMTTAATTIDPKAKEDAEIKAFYGDTIIRLEGQKGNPFRTQTTLLFKRSGRKDTMKFIMNTFQKDRGRKWLEEEQWSDFYWEYLVAVAGWE